MNYKEEISFFLLFFATFSFAYAGESVMEFAKGYLELEDNTLKGKNKEREPKWIAFFHRYGILVLNHNQKLHQTLDYRGLLQGV
jgi:hypothetical protein